ncbi:hypothetical protein E1301_Tti022186 [Triplophysa tibetana]|uniref:Uncharacterized protein n=1 Tax=Triplophysa tibetana TaxID=1572043 RepID=A0A5A9NSF0_9TELE|nr:hypothetical protein E1301_Tti022186 [Triplophysa tibetana]
MDSSLQILLISDEPDDSGMKLGSMLIEKLGTPKYSKVIIVIVSPLVALMDDQGKEAAKLGLRAAQLGVHND